MRVAFEREVLLQAVTEATLAQLKEPEWFTNVGMPDIGDEQSDSTIVVASWSEAMESCLSQDWEKLLHEAVNRYCEQLVVRSKERFQKWNSVTDELKPIVEKFVEEKCKR